MIQGTWIKRQGNGKNLKMKILIKELDKMSHLFLERACVVYDT